MKKLIESYNNICNKMVKEFCKKQEIIFEFWVVEEVGSTAAFGGGYYFDLNEIIFDLKTKQPKGLIIEYQEDMLDYLYEKDISINPINYKSYAMGLRYNQLKS